MNPVKLALLGDYSEEIVAHRAIPRALELARERAGAEVSWDWIRTSDLRNPAADLRPYAGLWLVPGSPYENTEGALAAVRWARESRIPFLGTCGGFQHALIEFARNVAGLAGADHAETNPGAYTILVGRLSCSLVGMSGTVHFARNSHLATAYGAETAIEGYHCNYGFNAAYRPVLEKAGMRFTAWDESGEVRGAELPAHPFFVGTLFQPERAALKGNLPPVAFSFIRAVAGI